MKHLLLAEISSAHSYMLMLTPLALRRHDGAGVITGNIMTPVGPPAASRRNRSSAGTILRIRIKYKDRSKNRHAADIS